MGSILAIPLVVVAAAFLLATGVAIGVIGIVVQLVTGRTEMVSAGAGMIRAIDQLPFGLGADPTQVYFIADETAAVKIGISYDPAARIAQLQTGHPDQLRLLRTVSYRTTGAARMAEESLHHRFGRQRLEGEWFDLSDRQLRSAYRFARRLR